MDLKKIITTNVLVVILCLMTACSEDDTFQESQLNTSTPVLSELDLYIRDNFVEPYNIDVIYQWNENIVDFNRFLFPPIEERVRPALEVVRKIWLDSYTELGGEDFVRLDAPRQLLLVGGRNFNQSGTILLGIAEGGKRISLFETDLVDVTDLANITRFIQTIQHEYVHILNQTKPFDEENFGAITPSEYTAQWFNTIDADARELGFLTAYARNNLIEDFAETVTTLLTNSDEEYNALIDSIVSEEARERIREKEAMAVAYYREQWDIDLYELQAVTAKNTQEIIN